MCDQWMRMQRLPLSIDQFHQLPRNPAYKYEYYDGQAHLSPRPRFAHAVLDLSDFRAAPADVDPDAVLRPMVAGDWEGLTDLFGFAFRQREPFGALSDDERRAAARTCLTRTRDGGDGPWVPSASFVAMHGQVGGEVGAALVTVLPDTDPIDPDAFYWREEPPLDCLERRLGRPHLTWIFVNPWLAGQGVATRLLAGCVEALQDLGYRQMASTFLLGNEVSLLWHWRNGFRLVPYGASPRQIRRRFAPPS